MTRVWFAVVALIVCVGSADVAHAGRWHAGLDLRADPGTHPIRAGGGVELGRFDTLLVLDPMFWTDGQHDLDLLTSWRIARLGAGPLLGWRTTAIGIQDGTQLQHKLVLGLTAPIAVCDSPALRVRWALELAAVLVKHGAGLPSETISFESGRDFVDLLNFGMFITVEYAGAF